MDFKAQEFPSSSLKNWGSDTTFFLDKVQFPCLQNHWLHINFAKILCWIVSVPNFVIWRRLKKAERKFIIIPTWFWIIILILFVSFGTADSSFPIFCSHVEQFKGTGLWPGTFDVEYNLYVKNHKNCNKWLGMNP